MPILPPRLDDRSFDDLLEDLLARIPAHTPEWTNPRLGDPGRTLLELFAWLGDALLYRVNLIPERQRLVFLKLLGQGLRPARPAGTIVSLAFAQPTELSALTLAAGARVKAPLPFETLAETTLLPVVGEAWYKQPLADGEAARLEAVIAGLQKVHRIDTVAKGYLATPLFVGGQAASGDGVDVFAVSVDRALWLALLAPVAQRPEQQAATNTAAGISTMIPTLTAASKASPSAASSCLTSASTLLAARSSSTPEIIGNISRVLPWLVARNSPRSCLRNSGRPNSERHMRIERSPSAGLASSSEASRKRDSLSEPRSKVRRVTGSPPMRSTMSAADW